MVQMYATAARDQCKLVRASAGFQRRAGEARLRALQEDDVQHYRIAAVEVGVLSCEITSDLLLCTGSFEQVAQRCASSRLSRYGRA
ncbi:MAG: hypothetical protein OXL68_01275 [Paracoccaceae bacterium]|nr:hypothetical protein [Paracoccaceae bacterium]